MKKREKGFTLFEVLVSMFITGVALLGLALMEVHILKSSQSSFNYTVATIRANSFINRVWIDLCDIDTSEAVPSYDTIRSDWLNEISAAGMTAAANSPPVSAAQNISIKLSWGDTRFIDDAANNTLTLQAKFPDTGCW